jgi:hypothetical protein
MHLFENTYKDSYLKFHTNPVVPNSLDPRVFYFPSEGGDPTIHPSVKNQILTDIAKINTAEGDYGMTRISDYILVGPVLEQGSSDKCPIIIKVKINTANLDDMLKERILNMIKEINGEFRSESGSYKDGTYVTGTQHKIYYIPTVRDFNYNEYNAVYHPYTDKWIKKPRFLGESDGQLADLAKDPTHKKKRKTNLVRSQLRKHMFQTK